MIVSPTFPEAADSVGTAIANVGAAAASIESNKSAVIAIVDSFLFICILFLFSYKFSVNQILNNSYLLLL